VTKVFLRMEDAEPAKHVVARNGLVGSYEKSK
jgi:hypothetical protein